MSEWDEKKQLVKGTSDKAQLINEYLYQLRNKVFQKEIELMEKGFMITANLLKEAVNDHVDAVNDKTLMQVFNDYQAMRKPLIGKKIAKDTYEDNALSGRYIKEFMEQKFHRKDIHLHEVKIGFIQGFHTFLLSEKNNKQNSCAKHLKFLKQLMNIAVANGYVQFNPLNMYKVEHEPVEIDFLDINELHKIINFETPIKRFERTIDASPVIFWSNMSTYFLHSSCISVNASFIALSCMFRIKCICCIHILFVYNLDKTYTIFVHFFTCNYTFCYLFC